MRLVAMPANARALVIFGAQHLADRSGSGKGLDAGDERQEPEGEWRGSLQPVLGIIIAPPEGGDTALSFKGAELEGLQRQALDLPDKFLLLGGRYKIRLISKAGRSAKSRREETRCPVHKDQFHDFCRSSQNQNQRARVPQDLLAPCCLTICGQMANFVRFGAPT